MNGNRGGHGRGGGSRGGRGGRGRGRGGRNDRGKNRGGRRGGRRGGGGNRGRRSGSSGNQRERIQVESGYLVLIDQFMLANPQFLQKLKDLIDEEPERKDELVEAFGGAVVQLEPATYKILRDPYAPSIVVHEEGEKPETDDLSERVDDNCGRVFVDTRCLAMVDRELLDDVALLEKYQQLWVTGQDKACRDLLRDNGGAVRYGFERFGDELGVYLIPDENIVALWPDVSEKIPDDADSDEEDEEQEDSESPQEELRTSAV